MIKERRMIKYEYKIVNHIPSGTDKTMFFNELGEQGWVMCGCEVLPDRNPDFGPLRTWYFFRVK